MAQRQTTERNTRQKKAIQTVLEGRQGPMNIQEILTAARQTVPRLSLGTVYRVLNALVDKKVVDLIQLPGEPPLFEIAGRPHHHFYRCRYCGRMYEIPGSEEILMLLVPQHCTVEYHELYIAGKCHQCQPEKP